MVQHKLTVGNVEILALHDNESALPLKQIFPGVAAADWAPYQQRYPEGFSGTENLRVHFDCYLLRSQGRTILVDTGAGSMATNPGTVTAFAGGVDGRLLDELQTAGVRPGEVDIVFLTHLHPDHVGWNLRMQGSTLIPTFTSARYLFHQADWEAFKSPRDEEIFGLTFWQETLGPLETLGVIDALRRARLDQRNNRYPHPGTHTRLHESSDSFRGSAGFGIGRRVSRSNPGHRTRVGL